MESRSSFRVLLLLFTFSVINIIVVDCAIAKCDVPRRFGWKCRFECRCRDGADCDRVTGFCENGCEPGRYGPGCHFLDKHVYGKLTYTGSYGILPKKRKCLSWSDSRIPIVVNDDIIPGDTLGPFCRNPVNQAEHAEAPMPWCYAQVDKMIKPIACDGLTKKECPDFLYGSRCDQECHCSNVSEVCSQQTGFCKLSKRCHAGWLGLSCDKACPSGSYGIECQRVCGNCLHNSCDQEEGICLKGCQSGYHGTYCHDACSDGEYGINCSEQCGHCGIGHCDSVTGKCLHGICKPGFTGERCQTPCRAGLFGPKCVMECPYCHNGGRCHPETGVCQGGCAPGYMGKSCDQECPDGIFGANCTFKCGHCLGEEICDKFTGQCVMGCEQGFTGLTCRSEAVEVKEASATGGIVAGIVIGLLVTALILLLLLWRSRRFRTILVVSGSRDKTMTTTDTTLENLNETDLLLNSTSPTAVVEEVEGEEQEECFDGGVDQVTKEPIYVNINSKKLTNPIPVEDLQAFITKARQNDYEIMKSEHRDLPTGLLALCHTALKPENKPKNRYADIIAYDHSRVVLSPDPHDTTSEYVNANYMDGFNKPKAYIASQGPNKAMLNDFWKMIWQEKVTKIVMLTHLVEACKKKCEQYWPQEKKCMYGEVMVETLDTAEYTDYIIRTFTISVAKISRIIKQFHFMSWTDHGAPTYPTPLLSFRRKVQQYNAESQGPILVHCSAGIGRSGTYMAVDYLLQQAKVEGQIDLLQCAQLMRSNRVNMIQTWQQYSFIYDAVLEALLAGDTTITNSSFPEVYEDMCTLKPNSSNTPLEEQFETLQKLSPVIDRDECKAALENVNMQKSRFRNILPANRFRPHLFTPVDGSNDFINAVFLPSYTQRDAFIITQMPLPNTVADFWRLLYDYHSDAVVMLNEFDRNDKSCALYWPEEYGYTVEYGPLSIELLFSSEADTNITVRTFKLTNRLKGEDRAVKQFQFNAWPDYKSVPVGTNALLRLADAVQEWTRHNSKGPVTVHCMNGASKSGLFCACSLIFERMRVDMEVDVFQTVKQIRINRPHFVENMEQYQFCYQMALSCLDRQPVGIERQADRQTNDSIDSGIQEKLL